MIAAYVSGHGFGHATRVGEVLRAVRGLEPRTPLAVVTSGPEHLYRTAVPGDLVYRALECDVGLVQHDALRIDEAGTLERWRVHARGAEARAAAEAEWLRAAGVRVVIGDVPPLAFEAAARAGIPGVALANFSWDWVYRHLARRHPGLGEAADAAAAAYGHAERLLRLPFAGDLSAFRRVEDVPLVARRPALSREEARARLGLDPRPLVLLSFGGIGLPGFDASRLSALERFQFAVPLEMPGSAPNALRLGAVELAAAGLGYVDLVAAAAVVVTKPGYGIVTDAIGAGTRLVYTERGDFPEYPILVREMPRYLACVHLDNQALLSGAGLGGALDAVMERVPPAAPDLSGARRAAERLLALAS